MVPTGCRKRGLPISFWPVGSLFFSSPPCMYSRAPIAVGGPNQPSRLHRALPVVNFRTRLLGRAQACSSISRYFTPCGCSSVVERHVANVNVGRSNRLTRFRQCIALTRITSHLCGVYLFIGALYENGVVYVPHPTHLDVPNKYSTC